MFKRSYATGAHTGDKKEVKWSQAFRAKGDSVMFQFGGNERTVSLLATVFSLLAHSLKKYSLWGLRMCHESTLAMCKCWGHWYWIKRVNQTSKQQKANQQMAAILCILCLWFATFFIFLRTSFYGNVNANGKNAAQLQNHWVNTIYTNLKYVFQDIFWFVLLNCVQPY